MTNGNQYVAQWRFNNTATVDQRLFVEWTSSNPYAGGGGAQDTSAYRTGNVSVLDGLTQDISMFATAVPEPSSFAFLAGTGALALVFLRRRNRRAN